MTEEIKEILDKLKDCVNNPIDIEVDQFTQEAYHVPNYFCLDATTNDCKSLLNYITNLQKENEKLKERNKILANDITKDRINCDVIQTVCGIPIEEIPYLKVYKSRNEKVVHYIRDSGITFLNLANQRCFCNNNCADKILNILEGGDE